MNRIFIQSAIALGIIMSLIIEKSLYGTFFVFNLIQPSLIAVLILINLKNRHTFIWILAFYGLILDILNYRFIGLSSLVLSISLYLFYNFQIRFDKNKIFVGVVNLIFSYILAICYLGFKQFFGLEILLITMISFLGSSYIWLKR